MSDETCNVCGQPSRYETHGPAGCVIRLRTRLAAAEAEVARLRELNQRYAGKWTEAEAEVARLRGAREAAAPETAGSMKCVVCGGQINAGARHGFSGPRHENASECVEHTRSEFAALDAQHARACWERDEALRALDTARESALREAAGVCEAYGEKWGGDRADMGWTADECRQRILALLDAAPAAEGGE